MIRSMSRPTRALLSAAFAVALATAACDVTAPAGPATRSPIAVSASTPAGAFDVIDARETICVFAPSSDQHIRNGELHFRDFRAETRIESDDARYDGDATVVFRGRRSTTTGDGRGFGRFTMRPATIDGTWEGTWTGRWSGGLFEGTSIAHGTGALRGQVLEAELRETRADPATTPCPPAVGTQFIETVRIHAAEATTP